MNLNHGLKQRKRISKCANPRIFMNINLENGKTIDAMNSFNFLYLIEQLRRR